MLTKKQGIIALIAITVIIALVIVYATLPEPTQQAQATPTGCLQVPGQYTTIQAAVDAVQPGGCIVVAPNTGAYAGFKLGKAGNASAPITIYGGVVNGNITTGANVHYWVLDGLTVNGKIDLQGGWSQFSYDYGNNGHILRNLYANEINLYGHYITIDNVEVDGKSRTLQCIHGRDAPVHDIVISNSHLHHCTDRGIWFLNLVENVTIDNVTIHDITGGVGWGIDFDGANYPDRNMIVRNSTVYNITGGERVGIGLENPNGVLPGKSNPYSGIIENNTVYNVAIGIHTITYGLTGGFVSSGEYRTQPANLVIRNNTIHDTTADGILCRSTRGVLATGNTITNTGTGKSYFGAIALSQNGKGYPCSDWTITDNFVSGSRYQHVWWEGNPTGVTIDRNIYGQDGTLWYVYDSSKRYNFAGWKGLGRDINSTIGAVVPPTPVPPTATTRPPTATATRVSSPTFTFTPVSPTKIPPTVTPSKTPLPPTATPTPTPTRTPLCQREWFETLGVWVEVCRP